MADDEKKPNTDEVEMWWQDGEPDDAATLIAGPYSAPAKKRAPPPGPPLEKVKEATPETEPPEQVSMPEPEEEVPNPIEAAPQPVEQIPEPAEQTVEPEPVVEAPPPIVTEPPRREPAERPASRHHAQDKKKMESPAETKVPSAPVTKKPAAPPAAEKKWPTLQEAMKAGDYPVKTPEDVVGVLVIRETPQRVRRGQVVAVREARTLVGRGRKVHLLLDDPGVGEYHAVINFEQRSSMHCFTLYPLGGRTVEVNGNAVRPAACLRSGDRIRVGSSELVFFQVSLQSGAA